MAQIRNLETGVVYEADSALAKELIDCGYWESADAPGHYTDREDTAETDEDGSPDE